MSAKTSLILCAALLAGCAQLTVERIGNPAAPQRGLLVYYLPRTAIVTNISLTLDKCDAAKEAGHYKYEFGVTETVTPSIVTEPDPAFQYGISFDDARTWFKEINLTVTTAANGTLQSFNGQINDQGGALGIAALTAAVKIAGAAVLPGAPGVNFNATASPGINLKSLLAMAPPEPPPLCEAKYVDALATIKAAQKNLDDVKGRAVTSNYTQPQKDADIAAAQGDLVQAKSNSILQRTVTARWLPMDKIPNNEFDVVLGRTFDVSDKLEEWLTPSGKAFFEERNAKQDAGWQQVFGQATQPVAESILVKRFSIGNAGDIAATGGSSGFTVNDPGGLILRQPALGTLRVCKGPCSLTNGDMTESTNDFAAAQAIALPQFGQVRVLAERSVLFENATLVVTLNADGSLASIADHSVNTAATGIAGLGSAADAASAGLAARNTAITAANTAQVTKETNADTINKAHADCLTQKATIEAAGEKAAPCQ